MKRIFISEKTPKEIEDYLSSEGFVLRKLKCEPSLPYPVSSHADMLIFKDGRRMITPKEYYNSSKAVFEECSIIAADITLAAEYPKDTALNCFVIRDTLFGRLESICADIKKLYPSQVNLSQGYAKCSTLLFGDNAVTADTGIARALFNFGINVLIISPGHISLPGYDYGFIGGASFVYGNNVIFFGDISSHPDYSQIKAHIEDSGYKLLYTDNHPLIDLGGAVSCNNY